MTTDAPRSWPRAAARLLAVPALVLALALALAGCAGDGEPSDDPAPLAEPSAPATSESPSGSPDESPSEEPTESPSEPSQSPDDPTSSAPTEAPDDGDGGGGTFTYDDAEALVDGAAGREQQLEKFETRGSAVYCLLDGRFVPPSCELASGAVRDPEVCAGAPTDFVGRIELSRAGAAPQCNTDTIRGARAETLEEGAVVRSGRTGVRCAVLADGVVCVDPASRSGFQIAPGAYRTTDR